MASVFNWSFNRRAGSICSGFRQRRVTMFTAVWEKRVRKDNHNTDPPLTIIEFKMFQHDSDKQHNMFHTYQTKPV